MVKKQNNFNPKDSFKKQEQSFDKKNISKETVESRQLQQSNKTIEQVSNSNSKKQSISKSKDVSATQEQSSTRNDTGKNEPDRFEKSYNVGNSSTSYSFKKSSKVQQQGNSNFRKQEDFQSKDNFKKQEHSLQKRDISKETVESRQLQQSDSAPIKSSKIPFKGSISMVGKGIRAGETGIQKLAEQADDEGVKLVSQEVKSRKRAEQLFQKHNQKKLQKQVQKLRKETSNDEKNLKEKVTYAPKNVLKKGNVLVGSATKEIARQSYKGAENVLENADDEGVKLVSKGTKAIRVANDKIKKSKNKTNAKKIKLEKKELISQREFHKSKLTEEVRREKTATLNKKNQRKKMYTAKRSENKNKAFSTFSQRVGSFFKGVSSKLKLGNLKEMVSSKIALWFGGSALFLIPILFAGAIAGTMILSFGLGNSVEYKELQGGGKELSADVEKWRSLVESEADNQDMSDYVQLLLGIIQVETGGRGSRDIMQSSESAGYGMNYFQTEEESVRQGVKHLKGIVQSLKQYGKGFEKNYKLLAQAYNFGSEFANYVGRRGGDYTLDVAEEYSRSVVAPSLGNSIGLTYPYLNEVSKKLGKTYLYWNGGNFMYGEMVGQYVGGGGKDPTGIFQPVLSQTLNNGECYGLTAYYVSKLGGPQMMGSGYSYAERIGEDYDWAKYGWTVIMYPDFNELRAGDVINWTAGGSLAPGIWGHTGVIKEVLSNGNFATFEQNAGKGRVAAEYTRNVSMNQIRSIVRPPQ